jgi:uncharacterized membrane protein YfhO
VAYPGWKAKVDGRSTPVETADYVLRGVRLRPGSHRVEFEFDPASFRIGWSVSLVAAVALALLGTRALRRLRRAGGRRGRPTPPPAAPPPSSRPPGVAAR